MINLLPPLKLFFFNDTATTEIYTLSLHDALPISIAALTPIRDRHRRMIHYGYMTCISDYSQRSEEHTSELQSRSDLVCRLLLEKKYGKIIVQHCVHRRTGAALQPPTPMRGLPGIH